MNPQMPNDRLLLLINGTPLPGTPDSRSPVPAGRGRPSPTLPVGPAGALSGGWLRHLPYLAALAERGVHARIGPLPGEGSPAPTIEDPRLGGAGSAIWATFATGVRHGVGASSETSKTNFWDLLADKGKEMIIRHPTGSSNSPIGDEEAATLAARADWHFMMLVYPPNLAAETGQDTLRHWQEWDRTIAGIGMAAGPQTAVMVVGLPTAADPGVLVAGGGFIAQLGDVGTMELVDLAPTILWLLDVPPPRQMTGRVWDELWRPEADWSEAEQEALFQHLRGLGYLS